MTIRKCSQTRCTFHESIGHPEMCPRCSECNSPSNVVEDEDCVNCHNCLKDEGYIRSGLPDKLKEAIKEKIEDELEQELEVVENG